jgi:glutamate/tyrosine decarboxylase-like PLP-dependent enzyme
LKVTREAAEAIKDMDHVELVMEPELSIVVFRRVGWQKEQYYAWSDKVLLNGVAFVVPTSWKNETVLRICIVNPLTTIDDVLAVLESLRDNPT